MKNFIKKISVTVCMVAASAVLVTAPLTAMAAATPRPMSAAGTSTSNSSSSSNGTSTSTGTSASKSGSTDDSTGSSSSATTAPANNTTNNTTSNATTSNASNAVAQNNTSSNVTQSAATSTAVNKKYLTKTGGFLLFFLGILINFILSCWVANRFYRMARKSAQSSGEIRALRKDIEEKFASSVKDVSEPATEIMNRNEDYSRSEEGIAMPERHSKTEMNDDELEMMRRWEKRQTTRKTEDEPEADDYEEDDYEERPKTRRAPRNTSYQPTRRASGIDYDEEADDEYDYEEEELRHETRRPSRPSVRKEKTAVSNAKNKAKDFLSNVFPFDE